MKFKARRLFYYLLCVLFVSGCVYLCLPFKPRDTTQGIVTNGSLTRLGKNLKFNKDTCPPGSMMLPTVFDKRFTEPPLHNDCPDLLLVGMRKSGSTSLIQYLAKHPDFGAPYLDQGPKAGETFYFNYADRYGAQPWVSYKRLFPPGKAFTGESTVDYIELGPQVIYRYCGFKPKIIILLRNPVDRFVSNVVMKFVLQTNSTETITQTVTNSTHMHYIVKKEIAAYEARPPRSTWQNISADGLRYTLHWSLFVSQFPRSVSLLFHGLYYVHIMNWLCNYPAENILIANSEEFFKRPSTIVKQVSQFIGMRLLRDSDYDKITSVTYNKGGYSFILPHHKISAKDRARLSEVYKPFNEAVLNLLDWPLAWN